MKGRKQKSQTVFFVKMANKNMEMNPYVFMLGALFSKVQNA